MGRRRARTAAEVAGQNDFTEIMNLVQRAASWTSIEAGQFQGAMLKMMRESYEQTLRQHVVAAGCDRSVDLTNGVELATLSDEAGDRAAGVVDTYNRDLAFAVRAIRAETPTANRTTYAKRIREFTERRDTWKNAQIALMSSGFAANRATEAFFRNNPGMTAQAFVNGNRPAAEPDCQALIDGEPYLVTRGGAGLPAQFPLHMNCPHTWDIRNVEGVDCTTLWTGQ